MEKAFLASHTSFVCTTKLLLFDFALVLVGGGWLVFVCYLFCSISAVFLSHEIPSKNLSFSLNVINILI